MENLNEKCREIRKLILKTIGSLGVGHIGGCLSITELLVVLYHNHMRIDAREPKKQGRDRLVLSKGHAGPALYCVLCQKGFFDGEDWLLTLNKLGTRLPSHCDMNLTPGVDMTTGSLGQGLSCAVGMAIASKICKDNAIIYAIIGDGESQEGQIWEASMYAAAQKLDNLIAFTDYNKMQIDGMVEEVCSISPIVDKWRAFGWSVIEVKNGHDCEEIDNAIKKAKCFVLPTMIILNTIKGKGVSFAQEAGVDSHNMTISEEMLKKELSFLDH
ncbi:MAG: transketolase [Oscillospiraceae bacterium]|jgi:transketolase|nr:transketolase [Oscillospiraceae bacterium]